MISIAGAFSIQMVEHQTDISDLITIPNPERTLNTKHNTPNVTQGKHTGGFRLGLVF